MGRQPSGTGGSRSIWVAVALCVSIVVATNVPVAQASSDVLEHDWCRYDTQHFELISDLPLKRAHDLVVKLERFRIAVTEVLMLATPKSQPTKALAFSRRKDFRRVFDARDISGFMRPDISETVLVFGPDRGGDRLEQIALHEYAHELLRNSVPSNYPYWFEEGFASYLSGMQFANGELVVGDATQHRTLPAHITDVFAGFNIYEVRQASNIKRKSRVFERILTTRSLARWSKADLHEFYSKSWLLVHRLQLGHLVGMTDQRRALDHYVDLSARGTPLDTAFVAAFGESYPSYSALQKELNRYSVHNRLPKRVIPIGLPRDFGISQVCLERADIAYELGVASAEQNTRYAAKLFAELPDEDVRAYIGRTLVHKARGQAQAAKRSADIAVALDSQNVLAKVLLGSALVDTCGRFGSRACSVKLRRAQAFFQAAHTAEAHRVDAVFGVGVTNFLLGEFDAAVVHLEQAYERAPWAPRINLFLGEAYRLNGDAKSAFTHLTIAANWEVDQSWRAKARQALALIPRSQRPRETFEG